MKKLIICLLICTSLSACRQGTPENESMFKTTKQVLKSQGYDFCQVYSDFQSEIKRSNREDAQTSVADLDKQEKVFKDYIAKYNLPDSLVTFIVMHGKEYCD